MTAATIPGLDDAPISHSQLCNWVRDIAELTNPDRVEWCDGSRAGMGPAHRPNGRRRHVAPAEP